MKLSVTASLVPEAKGGPFVFWNGLEDACQQAHQLGYHGIEVFPPDADNPALAELPKLLHKYHLQLAAVGTGAGWVKHKLRLTDPDPAVRSKAIQFVGRIIEFAGPLHAPAIIGSMQGRFEAAVTREQAMLWLAEGLEILGPIAQKYGVPLLVEPLNRYETNLINTVEHGLQLLACLQTKNVRLLLDLFHMNIEESSIADSIRDAGVAVGHVHWVDSNRRAATMGHLDLSSAARALKEIEYRGFVSAEALPLPSPYEAARKTIESYRNFILA